MYYSNFEDARQRPLVWSNTSSNSLLFNALDKACETAHLPQRANAKNLHLGMRDLPDRMYTLGGMQTFYLAAHYLGTGYSARRIPRIHYKLRLFHDLGIVVIRMIGDDNNAVILPQVFELGALHL